MMKNKPLAIGAGIGVGLVVVACVAVALFMHMLMKPPALATGQMTFAGLSHKATLVRDENGVPHIFAENLTDAYGVLGYAHAQDRLFQMEMMRRAATGRLAEVLGPELVNYDKKMRALGFAQLAQDNFMALSHDAQEDLRRYADGVNAYLKDFDSRTAPEFMLLGFTPAPWQPSDGLLWAKLMAWQLASNVEGEIFRATLAKKKWSRESIERLFPPTDSNVPSTLAPLAWVGGQKVERSGIGDQGSEIRNKKGAVRNWGLGINEKNEAQFFTKLPHMASNTFVITGPRTASGRPILENDPHLQLQAPVLWYLARLVVLDYEVKGASAPGLPFFPLGQNRHVAWGFTTNGADVEDLVFVPDEKENAKDYEVREDVIKVKGGEDVKIKIRHFENYPVLSDAVADIKAITPEGKAAVLVSTLTEKYDRTADALMEINRALKMEDAQKALPDYMSPPQNLMLADADGHIGYFLVGALPKRLSHDGFMPLSLINTKVWDGLRDTAENPHSIDPPEGVLLNANNAPLTAQNCAGEDCRLTREWADPYRAMRLEEVLAPAKGMDAHAAFAVALDTQSVAAKQLLPLLLELLDAPAARDNFFATTAEKEAEEKKQEELRVSGMQYDSVITALRNWNGAMKADAPEPLIFNVWMQKILDTFFGDAALNEAFWPRLWALQKVLESHADTKINIAVAQAFNTTMNELKQRFGEEWTRWRWGDLHKAPMQNLLWSKVPLINERVNMEIPTDGDATTLQRAAPLSYHGDEAYLDIHGAGYRAAYDVAAPANSRFMISTGQSGRIFSKHYNDLQSLWRDGQSVALTGELEALKAKGGAVLEFAP